MEPSSFGVLNSKLNIGSWGVDVLEELMTVFWLLDDKDAIHKLKPQVGRMGG